MNHRLECALLLSLAALVLIPSARCQEQTNPATSAAVVTDAVSAPAAEPAATMPAPPEGPAANVAPPAEETAPTPVPSQAPGSVEDLSKEEMLKQLKEVTNQLRDLRSEVNRMQAERAAEAAEKSRAPAPVPPPAPAPAPEIAARPEGQPPTTAQPQQPAPQENDEQARIERERAIRSVARSGVLLPRGAVEVEPSMTYSHFSSNFIDVEGFNILPVLVLGNIESLRIKRDVYQPGVTLRYGLWNNLQVDVTGQYRFEEDNFVRQVQSSTSPPPPAEKTITDSGVADTVFGLSRQVFYERGLIPDTILSVRATAPTGKSQFDIGSTGTTPSELAMGSGVWNVRGGVTAIKSLDPAVLILNLGYTYNFSRDFTAITNVVDTTGTTNVNVLVNYPATFQPGNSFDYAVAVAMALNPVFAINLQIHQQITEGTTVTGFGKVQGSSINQADLRFGFAWAVAHNATVNFSAAAGLTEDTPDMVVSLSMPIRF